MYKKHCLHLGTCVSQMHLQRHGDAEGDAVLTTACGFDLLVLLLLFTAQHLHLVCRVCDDGSRATLGWACHVCVCVCVCMLRF
jgi:hypothetical protein